MTPVDLCTHLNVLGLTQSDAAALLGTTTRTLRRWSEGSIDIPGPAEQALRAWARLEAFGLPWRPDAASFLARGDEARIAEQVAVLTQHAVDLDAVLQRVRNRSGPAMPFNVDLRKHSATGGPLIVSFYRLHGGGFSPQAYRRRDGMPPDVNRDRVLLEDAWYCIAQAIAAERKDRRGRKR